MTDSTTPAIADPGELGPSATPAAPAARPSAPENPRSRGHSPAIEQREAAAQRAGATSDPSAPPPAKTDAPAPTAGDKVKVGEMEVSQAELQEFFKSKGEAELRKATLPATPENYEAKLPENFEMPAGVEFKVDPADPLLADARRWAHAKGFDQSDFSELVGIYATAKAKEAAFINTAAAAELGKLGANAVQRVSAIENFLRGHLSDDLAKDMRTVMVTEKIVRGWETIMRKMQSQGAASFSQAHRVAPDSNEIAGYDKMTFEQRRYAQDQRARR
jgi:hypothetical protein